MDLGRRTLLFTGNSKFASLKAREKALNLSIAGGAGATTTREGVSSGTFSSGASALDMAGIKTVKKSQKSCAQHILDSAAVDL